MTAILPRTPEGTRERLIAIVRERSFQSGETFRLASGRMSNLYFNMKPTMLDPEGAYLLASLLLDAIGEDAAEHIGGLEVGAIPLATAVAVVSHLRGRPRRALFVRKATKEHGTQSLVEGLRRGESLSGRRVIVLEDVTTTGGSALKAAEALRGQGAIVDRVITLLDREEGAEVALSAAGLALGRVLKAADFTS
mgnify:CR=1 FL=1